MTTSLQKLLAGLIDYAGLFPPAKLPLAQAINNYAHYRQEADSWILGRFICPVARLVELQPFVEELFVSRPLVISALGQASNTEQELYEGFGADLDALATARNRLGKQVRVDMIEVRISPAVLPLADPPRLLDRLGLLAGFATGKGLVSFFEMDFAGNWRQTLSGLVRGCADCRVPVGLKVRCGGLEASAFPTVAHLACAIRESAQAGVPLKFTAGLHQPLRHFDPELQTHRHGFINVFAAGVLGSVHSLAEEVLQGILQEEDASQFRWQEDGFSWRDWRASVADIERARRQAVLSFGSCSFAEPLEGLRAVGWL